MTFHDHLGADENIYFPLSEVVENASQFFPFPGTVPVESSRACFRKNLLQLFFHFLRSNAPEKKLFARALRTQWGCRP